MLFLLAILGAVLCPCSSREDEFANFRKTVLRKYLAKMRPQMGRAADPCRVAQMYGRAGQMPNVASRHLNELDLLADKAQVYHVRSHEDPELAFRRCEEALLHNDQNAQVNIEICAEALAYFRNRNEVDVGRSAGGALDELLSRLEDSMSVEDIINRLDVINAPISMGILIDDTGSMSNDIEQVIHITRQLVEISQDNFIYNFVAMTFGDPEYQNPTSFNHSKYVLNHLEQNVVASMGGDCPENTCQALLTILSHSDIDMGTPIYVFTDASSKDCDESFVGELEDLCAGFDYHVNFVLTGSCDDKIDGNFTQLARATRGSVYWVRKDQIHLLSDKVQDSLDPSYGEIPYLEPDDMMDWGYWRRKRDVPSNFAALERHRRNIKYDRLSFYVDETVGKLRIQVTFDSPADRRILNGVKLVPPAATDEEERSRNGARSASEMICTEAEGEKFGNIVHYSMQCPCVGEWRLIIPFTFIKNWSLSAKTFGQFTITFDATFEQQPSSQYNERSKQPCVGERSVLWVRITQDNSIQGDDVTAIINNSAQLKLVRSTTHEGYWTSRMVIPKDPFTIAIRGYTVEGNVFLRLLNTEIVPVTTCLRTVRIAPSRNTIRAGGQTDIIMALKNKDTPKQYILYCLTDRQKDGFKTTITRPKWHYDETSRLDTEVNRFYYIYIQVKAPPITRVGDVVTLTCFAVDDNSKSVSKKYAIMITSVQ